MLYSKPRRQCLFIVLLISQLLIIYVIAEHDQQQNQSMLHADETLSADKYDLIKNELNKKIKVVSNLISRLNSKINKVGIKTSKRNLNNTVTNSNEPVNTNGTANKSQLVKELHDKYKEIFDDVTELSKEIKDNTIDIVDAKMRIDILESKIIKLYNKFDDALRQDNQKVDDFTGLLKYVVSMYKRLIQGVLDKVEALEEFSAKRTEDYELMFLEAMYSGNIELAAVKLVGVSENRRVVELLDTAYQEMDSIDGLLYLGSIMRDLDRRYLIYKTVYGYVQKYIFAKSNACDLLKLMYFLDRDTSEILSKKTDVFVNIFALNSDVKLSILLLTFAMARKSLGEDVYITSDPTFLEFPVYSKWKIHLQTISYSLHQDLDRKGFLRCSGVKISSW